MPIPLEKGKTEYTPEEVTALLEKQEGESEEAVETAQAVAQMSDVEKAHFGTLTGVAANEFLFMEPTARVAKVASLEDADPVVFTTADGTNIRKSADPMILKMAKDNDRILKDNAELREKSEGERLNKLADGDFKNLPGETETRVALIKAAEGIPDEKQRGAALDSLRAQSTRLGKALETVGTSSPASGQPAAFGKSESEVELDTLVEKAQKEDATLGYYDAYDKVSKAHPDLYAKAVNGV